MRSKVYYYPPPLHLTFLSMTFLSGKSTRAQYLVLSSYNKISTGCDLAELLTSGSHSLKRVGLVRIITPLRRAPCPKVIFHSA
jgi:hypothetical protein